jgi:hypothetical protein
MNRADRDRLIERFLAAWTMTSRFSGMGLFAGRETMPWSIVDGMELAVLRGDRVARNEVCFDRTALGLGPGTA